MDVSCWSSVQEERRQVAAGQNDESPARSFCSNATVHLDCSHHGTGVVTNDLVNINAKKTKTTTAATLDSWLQLKNIKKTQAE